MQFVIPAFSPAMPEIVVLTFASVVLLIDVFLSDRQRNVTYYLSMLTLLAAAVATLQGADSGRQLTFGDQYISDAMARTLKMVVYAATAVVFLYSREYLRQNDLFKGEFYVLGLFGMLGMMVMISAYSLLTLYLGLELLSLSLYAMVAFKRDSMMASEAAMKYFVLGAIASGCLLYGMSILYGVTGSLGLAEISDALANRSGPGLPAIFGLTFVLVGVAFKFGAVPFHMWLPDVYQGAPAPVTLYVASAPKLAAFAMAIRLLGDGLEQLHGDWQDMVMVFAILSIGVGNLVAIVQTNLKRMLGYSTISHVGFILLGLLTGTQAGFAAAMYYTIAYVIMATAAIGMILYLSRRGSEAENLDDFRGLNARSPWFAAVMLVAMFSMAGIPPFIGFYAKLAVILAAVEAGMVWLAVYAVVMSVVGAFYYLRIVKLMYFDTPEEGVDIASTTDLKWVLSANAGLIVFLGIFPEGLLALCTRVFL